MSTFGVLVYDDQSEIAEDLADEIRSACVDADVRTADSKDFNILLNLLNRRRAAWRVDGEECEKGLIEPHEVDEMAVIVVDYDLLSYSDTGDTTGSRLAYLLRCFSTCGLVIVLNEYGRNTFDASLSSPAEDFADIHVGAVQIGNPGLWNAKSEGYRPWYWPIIPDAYENFEKCVDEVTSNLDQPILDFFGLMDVIDWIPTKAREFLAGTKSIEDVTFESFIKSSRGGINDKDRLIPEQLPRVSAARIMALLNSIILPGQNVLVDAPHLVSRFPSLLLGERGSICIWNRLCNPEGREVGDLLSESLNAFAFQKPHWLWRPAWHWSKIFVDESVAEVRDPWTLEEFDWVFCENLSEFRSAKEAEEFYAIVSPPFVKRYVYRSKSQDAHITVDEDPSDPSQVKYVPQTAFIL